MSKTRPLIPRPGNAARPVFFVLLVCFGLMLIGIPILMYADGLGVASIVWATLLILAVTVGFLWFTVQLGQNLQADEASLDAGEVWAEWTVPYREHRDFVSDQRRDTNRRAVTVALGGTAFGLLLAWLTDDALLGGIMIGVFLLAGVVTLLFAGPSRDAGNDAARHVRIGPSGIHYLGRYVPFNTTLTRLRQVQIDDGDPPVIRFTMKAGRRFDEARVPVPTDQIQQAEALTERLRQMYNL